MKMRTMKDVPNLAGKNILLRCDFNIKIVDGELNDTFKITESLPTIKKLMEQGARIAILSHLGRPKGRDSGETLAPIAKVLGEMIGKEVLFVTDALDKEFLKDMKDGAVALLENVRYYTDEEENNDASFAEKLATGFDIYINDAFGVSHRAHASVEAVTKFLPSFGGFLMTKEVETLTKLMANPTRPLVGIVGSSKVSTKLGVIRALLGLCDKVIIAGGLGTSFNIVNGNRNIVDKLLYDPAYDETIESLFAEFGDKIVLGIDKGVGTKFDKSAARTDKKNSDLGVGDIIMDEGPESVRLFKQVVDGAASVIYNGTLGMAEWGEPWGHSTFELLRHIAASTQDGKLESIIGGGDGAGTAKKLGIDGQMTYVSTGGGAFLEFIQGLTLPGVAALMEA